MLFPHGLLLPLALSSCEPCALRRITTKLCGCKLLRNIASCLQSQDLRTTLRNPRKSSSAPCLRARISSRCLPVVRVNSARLFLTFFSLLEEDTMNSRPFDFPLTLMQISDDLALAKTRAMLLESTGWQTHTCSTRTAPSRALTGYDVLIFCQTVPPSVAEDLALQAAEGMARPAILRILWRTELRTASFDRVLVAPVLPATLVESAWRLAAGLSATIRPVMGRGVSAGTGGIV